MVALNHSKSRNNKYKPKVEKKTGQGRRVVISCTPPSGSTPKGGGPREIQTPTLSGEGKDENESP